MFECPFCLSMGDMQVCLYERDGGGVRTDMLSHADLTTSLPSDLRKHSGRVEEVEAVHALDVPQGSGRVE